MDLNTKLISCLSILSLLLTGCSEAPSEVKQEIEDYNHAHSNREVKLGFKSISEALQEATTFCEDNSTNINIKNLILPDSGKMPIYNVRFDNSRVDALFTNLQDEPVFANNGDGTAVITQNDLDVWKNKKEYCFTAFPELDGINYYRNKTDVKQADWGTYYGQNMRMTDSGCITLYADEQNTGIGSAFQYPVEKRILNNFCANNDSYTLYDGTVMSISEATQFAQNFFNDIMTDAENNLFQYQVNYIDIRSVGTDKYGFYLSLCRKDKYGNLFDATPIYLYSFDEFESRNALIASRRYVWITSSTTVSEFEMNYTFNVEENGEINEIITLESAVNKLSEVLAQGKAYNFDTVELKYIFEVTQSDYIDGARDYASSAEYDSNMYGIVYSPDSIFAYGNYQITAIPYWVFTDITAQNTDTNCGGIFMINAIDGNLRIENIDGNGNQIIHY